MGNDDGRLISNLQYLMNQCIDPTDGDELGLHVPQIKHCIFCLEKIKYLPNDRWYIPADKSCCICERCFNDFKNRFHWKLLDGWDIEWP